MPAARSIWNGSIAFGAVVIPVKVFAAAENRTISFREVRESDGSLIAHARYGAESGDEIEYAEIEKAYDTGDGLVVLSKDEIAGADGPNPKVIEIKSFVKGDEIDPVYYDKAYHLGAGKGGDRAYRVLLAALERTGRVGVGRFVLRSREQLVALRPMHGVLGLQTMRYAEELVGAAELDMPRAKKNPTAREREMAAALIGMLSSDWDPERFDDTYREAVMELIEAKAAGKKVKAGRAAQPSDDNLMAALQASLKAAGPRKVGKPRATPKRAPTKKPAGPSAASKKRNPPAKTKTKKGAS